MGIFKSAVPESAIAAAATISVAATTAMPPPCGVGMLWEDRAFGVASAIRRSRGRIAHVTRPDNSAAAAAVENASSNCELAISIRRGKHLKITCEDSLGTPIGTAQ
jgi:hypothetical protein